MKCCFTEEFSYHFLLRFIIYVLVYYLGHLFSVNPRVLQSINGIFNFNERVILSGHWPHGIFMYAAIGAYNVGSIHLSSKMEKVRYELHK